MEFPPVVGPSIAGQAKLICHLCHAALVDDTVTFVYLGHQINYVVPACPICGQVYISHDLVDGRISVVEAEMEEK